MIAEFKWYYIVEHFGHLWPTPTLILPTTKPCLPWIGAPCLGLFQHPLLFSNHMLPLLPLLFIVLLMCILAKQNSIIKIRRNNGWKLTQEAVCYVLVGNTIGEHVEFLKKGSHHPSTHKSMSSVPPFGEVGVHVRWIGEQLSSSQCTNWCKVAVIYPSGSCHSWNNPNCSWKFCLNVCYSWQHWKLFLPAKQVAVE